MTRADFGKQIVFWDARTGRPVGTIQTPSLIIALGLLARRPLCIASGGITPDATLKVWNAHTHRTDCGPNASPAICRWFPRSSSRPDGHFLASGSQGRIACLWDARSGRLGAELTAPSSRPSRWAPRMWLWTLHSPRTASY